MPENERKVLLREVFYLNWYNAVERGQGMNDFFTGVLDFKQENVKQYTNISKAEIIKVLENLRQESQ